MKIVIILILMWTSLFAKADAPTFRGLSWGGFVVLNRIDDNELTLSFNYRIFWDRTVCGFMMVHAGDNPGSVLENASDQFEMTGSTSLEKSMLPHVDQMIFKVSEQDRGRGQFTLKTKNGKSIENVIGSMNLEADDQVVIMFSRNCVGQP